MPFSLRVFRFYAAIIALSMRYFFIFAIAELAAIADIAAAMRFRCRFCRR